MNRILKKLMAGVLSVAVLAGMAQMSARPVYGQIGLSVPQYGQKLSAPVTREQVSKEPLTVISDFDSFAGDYAYQDIETRDNADGRKALYGQINEIAEDFWNNEQDLTTVYNGLYEIATVNLAEYGMTFDDVVETYFAFKEDHPLYYYLSNMVYIKGIYLYIYANADYAKGADRKKCQQKIIVGLNDFISAVNGMDTDYDILLETHDIICDKIHYAYKADGVTPSDEAYAHNIMGFFDDTYATGVCECYARTYQLVMNMLGIENVYVTGVGNNEDHVWNIVKLDGQYYYTDCTWDDGADDYAYYLKGAQSVFKSDHFANTNSQTGVDYLYPLPEISQSDYILETDQVMEIDSARDLKRIALKPDGLYRFTKDVDFSSVQVKNANVSLYFNYTFGGTIDGAGYQLKGLKAALFNGLDKEAVIKNLKMEADFSGSAWTDAKNKFSAVKYVMAQDNYGLIDHCEVVFSFNDMNGMNTINVMNVCGFARNNRGRILNSDAKLTISGITGGVGQLSAGGIAFNNYGRIDQCSIELDVKNNMISSLYLGGMCANTMGADSIIRNCKIGGSVKTATNCQLYYGGVVVENSGIIDGCESSTAFDVASNYSGGITGYNHFIVKNCKNTGAVSGNVYYLAGIAGYNKGLLLRCTNTGNVGYGSTSQCAGGIAGITGGDCCVISDCENRGAVSPKTSGLTNVVYTGGIVGRIALNTGNTYDANNNLIVNVGYVFMKNCKNAGTISGSNNGAIAGIISVAKKESQVILKNCTNTGTVSGKTKDTLSGNTEIYNVAKRDSGISVVLINQEAASGKIALGMKMKHVAVNETVTLENVWKNRHVCLSETYIDYAGGVVTGVAEGTETLVIYDDKGEFDFECFVVDAEKTIWNEAESIRGADKDHYGILAYSAVDGSRVIYEMTAEDPTVDDATKVLYGDADRNGVVDSTDLVLIKKYLAGYTVAVDVEKCDVSGDGILTSADVVIIAKYLSGYPISLWR